MFLNGDGLRPRRPYGESIRDDSFVVLFNAFHEDPSRSAAALGVSAPAGDRAVDGRARAAPPRRAAPARRGLGRRHGRSWCCAGSAEAAPDPMPLVATYRLQLGPDLDFERRARTRSRTSATLGVSHLYLSPVIQARAGSTHGYDVVDPTRMSDRPRRRGRELRALAGAGLGLRPRRRPQPHGRSTTQHLLERRDGAAGFFDLDPVTGRPSPVLRRRRARRRPRRGPRGVRRRPTRRCFELVGAGVVDGLRVDHVDGLADPAGVPAPAAGRRRRARLGREDPRDRRAAASTGPSRAPPGTSS